MEKLLEEGHVSTNCREGIQLGASSTGNYGAPSFSGNIQSIAARRTAGLHAISNHVDNLHQAFEGKVFLKVSPTRGVQRFGVRGKLSPKFIGPFEILRRVGEVSYELALPPSLAKVHNVFHVSQLRKYVHDPSHVLAHEPLLIEESLVYEERPIRILDTRVKELRNSRIPLVKVLWSNHGVEEATWEKEIDMRERYPNLFESNEDGA
ncbi:uncharacterized protein LOC130805813 [Amaranthus tricolor]|uniref:uncharacterized protein LOC130805813 n=1 Tax=Amaranthus tricolor TaxID=29722 RepID=UPI002590A773|nr:uncharacterized protein LOC130805813 [Amaranthus tricolor]